jgi:hypothetical protein
MFMDQGGDNDGVVPGGAFKLQIIRLWAMSLISSDRVPLEIRQSPAFLCGNYHFIALYENRRPHDDMFFCPLILVTPANGRNPVVVLWCPAARRTSPVGFCSLGLVMESGTKLA